MESSLPPATSLTPSQQRAVTARGNVLVMAGAGTGKTKTLVTRCLDCLARERAALDELLIVTFTEAAAAELRHRLRRELENQVAAEPGDDHWPRQLALFDLAHIGTLHSFCLRLVREHFHELGLDPQLAILDTGEARQRASETLNELFQTHYAGEDEFSRAVQNLIHVHGGGRDENIRQLVLRLHHYSQTRPDAAGWLKDQLQHFSQNEPTDWQRWLTDAIADWRSEWLPILDHLQSGNEKAAELKNLFARLTPEAPRAVAADWLEQIISADGNWPAKKKTVLRQPLAELFAEAALLASLAREKNGTDPLAEDWGWVREHMATLLQLAQAFAAAFAAQKRADGVVDFHDLEQFALQLLWDFSTGAPTAAAESWRQKLRFVFVDEYQDINAAQDKIIAGLSRSGAEANRFLVGDVKQSIYRFRLADPKIFRDYARDWRAAPGQVIPLAENFRSRAALLALTNSMFAQLMREAIGGVAYDAEARLQPGRAETDTAPAPRAELLLRLKAGREEAAADDALAELADADREARHLALRLQQLVAERHEIFDAEKKIFRAVEWQDIAVLLRSPAGKAEIFAKQFALVGVPLAVARGGFYETAEILDLLSLLQLLDNPLQDVPCLAVLRSPLVGLTLDELAEIRLAAREKHFWTAVVRWRAEHDGARTAAGDRFSLFGKIDGFLERFARWRVLAKQHSLAECLEAVLAETLYADWLRTQPRGAQRCANLASFLHLAEKFDQFQRQGLYRFLQFITAQQAAEVEPEVAAAATENAVRLMSIHQSKGLEFPVVALPDLAKRFNEQDRAAEIIFDETFGLCPKVKPPASGRRYPSLPHWLAQRRQRRELRGEELRLLYVALTRARDTLLLTASVTEKKWENLWRTPAPVTVPAIAAANSFADWLGLWFANQAPVTTTAGDTHGEVPHLRWRMLADAEIVETAAAAEHGAATADVGAREDSPQLGQAIAEAADTEPLRAALNWQYPHLAATQRKAKATVTELRRATEETDAEAEPLFAPRPFSAPRPRPKLSAAETGTAHHRFLQHFELTRAGDLAAEADRLAREKILSADERAALDLPALAAFWDSTLGQTLRAQATRVRRELPFTARFRPEEIAVLTGPTTAAAPADEFLIVQGVADLVLLGADEIWLVDFKTDEVDATALPAKIKTYRPQLELYAAALHKIFGLPVTRRALHFLALRRTELL